MKKQVAVILFALGMAGVVSANGRYLLARFDGGIGVIPVSNGAGPANPDGTLPNVRLNVVRGASAWRRAVEDSPVSKRASTPTLESSSGRGLLLASGTPSGRTPIRKCSRP